MTVLPSHCILIDGRQGAKRARLQARHPVRGRAAGGGTTGFCPSLKVATCDYAGQWDDWELFSGQLVMRACQDDEDRTRCNRFRWPAELTPTLKAILAKVVRVRWLRDRLILDCLSTGLS